MVFFMSSILIDDFLKQVKSKLKAYLSKEDTGLFLVGKFGTISYGYDIPISKRVDLLFLDGVRKKSLKVMFSRHEGILKVDKYGSGMDTMVVVTLRFIEKIKADIKVSLSSGGIRKVGLYDEVYHNFQFRFDVKHGLFMFTYTIYNKTLPDMSWHKAVDTAIKALKIYAFAIYELEYGLLGIIRDNIDDFIDIIRGAIYG